MDRRSFLKHAAMTATAAVPFTAFMARVGAQDTKTGVRRGHTVGYGPLFETLDLTTGLPLIALPAGFEYVSFGWRGDLLDNGDPTPAQHDGMAAFAAGNGRVRLVRNHEVGPGTPFSTARYNPAAGGGTTTIEFDTHDGKVISMRDSLSGTIRNCAGGLTPWGTWITSEETTLFHAGMPHGYNFEVPAVAWAIRRRFATWAASHTKPSPSIRRPATSMKPKTPAIAGSTGLSRLHQAA